ncbi:MAG: hypothetical protein H6719_10490 [Sandaracinaceae bacterium]|nr:hypothetical protein [Sandaracinaceae bacterium]
MNNTPLRALTVLVVTLAGGCDPGSPAADYEGYLLDTQGAACQHYFDCCTAEERASQSWLGDPPAADVASCEAMPRVGGDDISEAIAAGRIRFDPVAADACLRDFEELSCDVWARRGFLDRGEPCGEVLVGLVEPGGECESPLECADHGWCRVAWGDTVGTCEAHLEAGEACVRHDSACPPGLTCRGDGSGATVCGAPLEVGEPCEDVFDCRSFVCGDGVCEEASTTPRCGG